ncbi:MAG TPA: glycosyl hydrolase family 17 protein [Alphaproteobacteria bacterium]|nr:glycosyl hydrolase family 17 protein [Alphaproteobacteria bacterium]
MSRWAAALAAFVLAALLNLAYWAEKGRPVDLPEAGADSIASVSFSPYRSDENPLTHITPSLDEISSDLATLAGHVDAVRTYTSLEGLDSVAPFARPLGIKVMQSAWLGRDPDINEREIRRVIALANRYPDVIDRVIVGNEVILRRDLTPDQLAGYIRRVKAAIKQPVSYADVWEFWLKNPQLAAAVDFVTVHILPYWEDDPVPIEHAIDHVAAVYHKVQAAFPGKPIMIGETGWPSTGRMRRGALPSLVNEARFVREFIRFARTEKLDYNVVEAFDQPWKRALEGTVGGHWGIFDAERHAKFSLSGPVSNDPDWRWHWALSTALAALAGIAAARWRRPLAVLERLVFAGAAQLFGTLLVLDGILTTTICWTPFGVIAGGLGLVASLILVALLLDALARGPDWPGGALPTAEEALNLMRGQPTPGPNLRARILGLLQFGFAVGAAVVTIALVIDPRYRDFPSEAFLVAAVGLSGFALWRERRPAVWAPLREEALLVALLLFGAAGIMIREGFENSQAIGWSATALLLALPWSIKLVVRRRAAPAPAAAS